MYCVILLGLFICNKLFSFTGLETSIWTCHFRMHLYEVTQRITTGNHNREASVAHNRKGLTFGGESSLGSSVVSVIKSVVTLCTPAKNRKVSVLQSKSAVIKIDHNTTNKNNKCKEGKGGPQKLDR